jgi:glycosyltransferase involved in cell wall biosynthesis
VVSTAVGAEGLELRDGENILLADEPKAFADEIVRLLNDPALAGRAGDQGRLTVESHYDWRREYAAWDRVYR